MGRQTTCFQKQGLNVNLVVSRQDDFKKNYTGEDIMSRLNSPVTKGAVSYHWTKASGLGSLVEILHRPWYHLKFPSSHIFKKVKRNR